MTSQEAIELLNILRSSIFNKEEHKYALTEKYVGQKFMLISMSVRGDDNIIKIKEWLQQ